MAEHMPRRPEWTCRTDGKPWPCGPARAEIRSEYREAPSPTDQRMFTNYLLALGELPDEDGDALFARFVNWVRVPE